MIARLLYSLTFVLVLPVLLAVWAWRLDAMIAMPVVQHSGIGIGLTVIGLVLIAWSTFVLWVDGGGLPMNAFPPPRFTRRGPYCWIDNPIYIGFVAACFGISLLAGSPAGFWIVSPFAAMGCAALVWGYEVHDLDCRFGQTRKRPLLRLPPQSEERPKPNDFWSVLLLLYLPWLGLYEWVGHIPVPDHVEGRFNFERDLPVIEWTEAIYASLYFVAILAVFTARQQRELRWFMISGWTGTFLGILAFLTLPLEAPPRPFEPVTIWGELLQLEQADGVGGRAAFPAFHVFWSLLVGWLISRHGGLWRPLAWSWAGAVIVSCVTTGMHAIVDLPAGILLFALAFRCDRIWFAARAAAEQIANSWREWRLGPVRIINHGFYAGLAAACGVLLAGILLNGEGVSWLAAFSLVSLLGAGIWGQLLVGSKTLLRPFGYFGTVVGIAILFLGALAAGVDLWPYFTALAVAGPWIQAIGRCRCLIQGCCHGAPVRDDAAEKMGVRYHHPRSRVCRLAGLRNVPLHPTPLYSIAGNVVIGLLLLRLWIVDAPATLIVGGYLILTGLLRFVEESFRGEPQTPIVWGLRLYQWLAAGLVVAGITISCLPVPLVSYPSAGWDWTVLNAAALIGGIHVLAMGVDFPHSDKRFSRLV